MEEVLVTIKIYADDLYSDVIQETSCFVGTEFDDAGDIRYSYGWDHTLGAAIEECMNGCDWRRAVTTSCNDTMVEVFLNDEYGPEYFYIRSDGPFVPFVLLLGKKSLEDLATRFADNRLISKSISEFDSVLSKVPDHPESIASLFLEMLKMRKERFDHFDAVYEPEIRSLQMLQWVDEYSHMFYFTTQDEISKFRKIRSRFEELDKVERSLTNFLDDMNESDQANVKEFLVKVEAFKEDIWQKLLGMSLARTMLDAE